MEAETLGIKEELEAIKMEFLFLLTSGIPYDEEIILNVQEELEKTSRVLEKMMSQELEEKFYILGNLVGQAACLVNMAKDFVMYAVSQNELMTHYQNQILLKKDKQLCEIALGFLETKVVEKQTELLCRLNESREYREELTGKKEKIYE